MTIRFTIQMTVEDDTTEAPVVHQVARIDRDELKTETLGLTLADGQAILRELQSAVTARQILAWQARQRFCPVCGRRRRLKGRHRLVYRTVYGTVLLDSERLHHCFCEDCENRSFSPLARLLPERISPELLYLETKWASLVSYGLAARLLSEVLPLDKPLRPERLRRHLHEVAERQEADLGPEPMSFWQGCQRDLDTLPIPDGPMFVGLDGGYVRGREGDWFEVIVGKSVLSFRRDDPETDTTFEKGKCFAFVQTLDEKPKQRLYEMLRGQGLQPNQQLIVLSDGGDTVRRLQTHLGPEAEHVLDWFHLTMRLTVLRQMVKGAAPTPGWAEDRLRDLERIKWLLWNGHASAAIEAVEDMEIDVECAADEAPEELPPPLHKLRNAVADFRTYLGNNAGMIVDYGERYRAGERISTGFVESAINQVVGKRFGKSQSMRWTRKGAHLLLQTRTRVLNEELDDIFRSRYPGFRALCAATIAQLPQEVPLQ
jgi:hypothetical protein